MWAYTWTSGKTVYFNMENCTDFGTPYARIGNNGDWSNAYLMTLVAGTEYLYSYTKDGNWDNAAGWSVANSYGWQGDNDNKNADHALVQPTENQAKNNDGWVNNACRITKQTDYQRYNISDHCYVKITSTSNTERGCTYYHVNNVTSGDGSIASLPSYTVSYAKTGSGTLSVTKYNGSTFESFTSGSSVNPTQIMKITATPSSGYALTDLTISGATATGRTNEYYVTGNTTISATFTYIQDITIHVKNTDSWGGIKVYQWNHVTGATGTAFPGDAATSYNGSNKWYNVVLSTAYTRFIICNSSATGTKTGDIPFSAISANGCYTTASGSITYLPSTDCPTAPSVTTATTASGINLTSMTLHANGVADNSDDITNYGFKYGTTSDCSDGTISANNLSNGSFSKEITNLSVGTKYYYKAYATNAQGTTYGEVENASTTAATLSLSGTKDYTAKTMTITPTHNVTPENGYSGDKYICCTCTSKPGGAEDPTITWNSTTKKIDITGATTSGDYTFNVQLKPVSDCSGGAFNNATANITITMKDFVDFSELTIGHTKYNSTYMAGDGANATPYFVYLQHAGTYGKLNLSATLASALSDGALYYSVGGDEIGTVTLDGTAASITMDLPNKTVGDKRSATIQFYHKLDGQTAPNAKRASVTIYYQVYANPVVTLTATYNGNPIVGEIPQSATVTLSASVTNIPGEPTFKYSKGSGEYSSTASYTLSEAGTTTMHAKTTYLGDWSGDLNITTYAANSATYYTRKTDMYGDVETITSSRLFKNVGEEYTAPDIEGYTFSSWSCSTDNDYVRLSEDEGANWKTTSTEQTVTIKATAAGGAITANYTEVKRIYFDNRNTNWDTVYIYLFSDEVWHSTYGVQPKVNRLTYSGMTRIGMSNIYYFEYESDAASFVKVAFCEADQHDNNYLYATKAAYRGDFSTCNPVYVPNDTKNERRNEVDYYNNGYWRRYMPYKTGYSLWFLDKEVAFEPEIPGTDTENFKVSVLRSASSNYAFNIHNSCMSKSWGNNGTMDKDNCTNWTFTQTGGGVGNCTLATTAEGYYIFHLSTVNGQIKVSVEYPLGEGDYQIYYTDNTGNNNNYSDYIRKNTGESDKYDTVSFYVKHDETPKYQIKRCTGFDGSGDPTWENVGTAQSISVDKDSVYVFNFNQPAGGASISMTSQGYYTGKYYIRTDGASGGWGNYLTDPDNIMKQTDKASALTAGYNYYYLRWIGDKDGNSTTNVKYTVANDYNSSVSQELADGPEGGSLAGKQALTGKGANVRFTYNTSTNEMTRTCIGGSGHDANYLVIEASDNSKLKKSDGSAWSTSAMVDQNDWIYTLSLKAKHGAAIKLKSHYDDTYVDVYPSHTIFESSELDATFYDLKVIYDYKTNEIVAAYIPGEVDSELAVDVDIMFIRYAKDNYTTAPPTTLSFGPGGSITGDPKTLYGAIEFEKDYVRAEGTYAGLSSKRPQRSMYWISFPFDVQIKEIFGLGDYTETWILSRYRGDLRAANGWFLENDTFWEYILDQNETLKAGEGYVLSIDCEAIQWPNSRNTQYLYFPSKTKISTINSVLPSKDLSVPAHTCTITSPADRHIKDSHWNVIGIPGFATGWGKAEATVTVAGGDFHYFYTWDPATNTLSSASAKKYQFVFMHSYMVQYTGDISWTSSEPATLPARRIQSNLPEEVEFRLALSKEGQEADHTFVTLMDNEKVTADFDMNTDLVKMFNSNQANIYTMIGSDVQAAANCLPLSQTETTLVPMGVKTTTAGTYTISIPAGTYGIGVTLIDEQTGVRTSLSAMDYIVELDADDYTNRFFLEIAPIKTMPTDIENMQGDDVQDTKARKLMIDGILYIRKDGKIYDARGVRIQ